MLQAMARTDTCASPPLPAREPATGVKRDATGTDGPRALMRAVLQDAILCLAGRGYTDARRRSRDQADALRWVLSTDSSWLFSFESICEVLGLHAGYLRRRLLRATTSADAAMLAMPLLGTVRLRGNQRDHKVCAPRVRRRSRARRMRVAV